MEITLIHNSCFWVHEPDHNLPGEFGLDWTLLMVWLLREFVFAQLCHIFIVFVQRPRPDVHYSKVPPQFLRFILIQCLDLLRDDGGLNALGELYLGAKTVHTQNLTAPSSTYKTVNGADIPNQGPPTAWPVVNSASRPLLTVALPSQSLLATVMLIVCFFGAQWNL
jgi:hypothetical protein